MIENDVVGIAESQMNQLEAARNSRLSAIIAREKTKRDIAAHEARLKQLTKGTEVHTQITRKRNLLTLQEKKDRKAIKAAEIVLEKIKAEIIAPLHDKRNKVAEGTDAHKQITREINLVEKTLSEVRERGTFALLESKGPDYVPENQEDYEQAIALRRAKDVGVVIAYKLGLKEPDVDLLLQYAVSVGDLKIGEYYDRQPTTCTIEDIVESQKMRDAGISTGDIVVAMYLKGVRISKEIIAHPENYL